MVLQTVYCIVFPTFCDFFGAANPDIYLKYNTLLTSTQLMTHGHPTKTKKVMKENKVKLKLIFYPWQNNEEIKSQDGNEITMQT